MSNQIPQIDDSKKTFEDRQITSKEVEYNERVERLVRKYLEDDIGKGENADTQIAQLIHELNENGIHKVFEKVREKLKGASANDLSSVVDDINQKTKYLDEYMDYITAVILTYAAQDSEGKKDKLNIRELYRFNVAAKGSLNAHQRGYGGMVQKMAQGINLTQKEEKKLVQGLKSLSGNPGNRSGPLEQIQNSGAWAVVGMMNEQQRFNLAATFIKEKPAEAKSFLEGMTTSGILTIADAKALWPDGSFPEKDLQEKQQKVANMQRELMQRVATQHSDQNQILRFTDPKNLAGIALQVWGVTEMILNGATMAKAGDWKGFASNPWFLGGAAAAMAGHGMTTKGDMFAFIKEPSANEKEAMRSQQNQEKIGKTLTRYPTQFQQIAWDVVVADAKLMREDAIKRSKDKHAIPSVELTLKDIIIGMKEKNAKKPTKPYGDRIAALEMIQNASDTGTKLALNEAITLIVKTPEIATAANIDQIYKQAIRKQGVAQKKPIIKPVV
ncbi:MAG: hypothetical protein AAB551_02060 [Patescibacteria group bacterium]